MQLPWSLATSSHTAGSGRKSRSASEPSAVCLRPGVEPPQLLELLVVAEQAGGPAQGVVQPPQAEVVAPPLDQHGRELQRNDAVQQRQVLLHQLLLQADRVGGDDHAAGRRSCRVVRRPASCSPAGGQDGRHEVGEALAHAGARLDHQMVPLADGPIDGLGHGELLARGVRSSAAGRRCVRRARGFRRVKAWRLPLAVSHGMAIYRLHERGVDDESKRRIRRSIRSWRFRATAPIMRPSPALFLRQRARIDVTMKKNREKPAWLDRYRCGPRLLFQSRAGRSAWRRRTRRRRMGRRVAAVDGVAAADRRGGWRAAEEATPPIMCPRTARRTTTTMARRANNKC